jgi:hypothetical protein
LGDCREDNWRILLISPFKQDIAVNVEAGLSEFLNPKWFSEEPIFESSSFERIPGINLRFAVFEKKKK